MADKTSRTIETLIRARYPLIYVVSFEEERVCNAISKIAAQRTKQLYQWSVTDGLLTPDGTYLAEFKDPLKVLEYILQMDVNGLFILKDYHPFMNDPVVIRKLRDLGKSLKLSMKNVIFLSPMLKIPGELEKELTVVDYKLPEKDEIESIVKNIAASVGGKNQEQIENKDFLNKVL